jgi:uncharacterized protein YndB with AHSA1/START domain
MKILQSIGVAAVALLAAFAFPSHSQTESRNPMTQDTSPTRNLTVTRTFDAPLAEIWKHWSDSEKVMKWWGPKGFTSPLAKMDFREGGVSLVCMRAPKEFGGFDMYNTWTYKKIIPNERIEFTLNFSDKDGNKLDPAQLGLPPGIPKEVPHVITFKALGDKKTEMTVSEFGYTTDQAVQTSKSGLEECLDKMSESLKS